MPKLIDITGRTYERLTVLRYVRISDKSGKLRGRWLCVCTCGKKIKANSSDLRRGRTPSCGCLCREKIGRANRTHGMSRTKVYRAWTGMWVRCTNPKFLNYHLWGGRGITVCPRWFEFENFLADVGLPPTPKHSLDRFPNTNGNYEPGNVRWATRSEQANNCRDNHLVTFKGVTQSISLWAQATGIRPGLLYARLTKLGWSIERTLTEPPNPKRQAAALNRKNR